MTRGQMQLGAANSRNNRAQAEQDKAQQYSWDEFGLEHPHQPSGLLMLYF